MTEKFYIKHRLSNRGAKRLVEHEIKSLCKLDDVEDLMVGAIIDFDTPYKLAYDIHLELYKRVAGKMNPKYIVVNKTYFSDMYKPLDDVKNNYPLVTKIHELARKLFGVS